MAKQAVLKRIILSKYLYVFIFIAGAVAFFYPLVSSMINHQVQTRIIASYQTELASYKQEQKEKLRAEAQTYNRFLAALEGNVTDVLTEQERDSTEIVYMNTLALGDVIGYLIIDKIEVELPIYRGTSDEVLNAGIGHLERSSLPIGGPGSHAVLVGHRGLPSARYFRDLGLLEKGDIFLVNTLGETLAYEVQSISVVLPTEVESLLIQENRDLCTLVTCEPYMINSHRLLVVGERRDYDPQLENKPLAQSSFPLRYWEYFVIIGTFSFLVITLTLLQKYLRKKQLSGGSRDEN